MNLLDEPAPAEISFARNRDDIAGDQIEETADEWSQHGFVGDRYQAVESNQFQEPVGYPTGKQRLEKAGVVQQQYKADVFPGVFRQASYPFDLKTVEQPRDELRGQQE